MDPRSIPALQNTGANGASPVGGARPGAQTPQTPQETAPTSPAFRVLLEQLQEQSQSLSQREVAGPDELPDVVDDARATLEDALSLGDQLLEAYRATVQRGEGTEPESA